MKRATFSMGLPGAGKSSVVKARYPGATVIDPDAISVLLPDYDPKNPSAVHDAANEIAQGRFQEALATKIHDLVIDTTATNLDKLFGRMDAARLAGYTIHLLYVRVPLAVAIARNAARTRVVSEHVIRAKAQVITRAFGAAAAYADTFEVIDN